MGFGIIRTRIILKRGSIRELSVGRQYRRHVEIGERAGAEAEGRYHGGLSTEEAKDVEEMRFGTQSECSRVVGLLCFSAMALLAKTRALLSSCIELYCFLSHSVSSC